MKVDFTRVAPGCCSWCRKEKDQVITLAFADGSFVGSYCFADFKKALLNKLEAPKAEEPTLFPSVPLAQPVKPVAK